MRRLLLRLLNVFRRQAPETDLAREIAAHLTLIEDDFRRRGMTPDQARWRRSARWAAWHRPKTSIGMRGRLSWLDDARRDFARLQDAARKSGLHRHRRADARARHRRENGPIFSVVDALMLPPLPYPDAGRLVRIVNNVPAEESPTRRPFQNPSMTTEQLSLVAREHEDALPHGRASAGRR